VKEAGLAELRALVDAVRRSAARPARGPHDADSASWGATRLYLVSRTSHLAEGWCDRVPAFELAGDAGATELGEAVREAGRALGVDLVWESPADVIPLPAGWEERSLSADLSAAGLPEAEALAKAARPATIGPSDAGSAIEPGVPAVRTLRGGVEIRHFDPYSVVLRLIARGDEPDYVAALQYVLHGWVEPARLEGLLGEVVPRMTNETLAQDPAEFRRKFKGLRQLYLRSHAVYSPGGTRVGEAASRA
jgi:hypothetical protein